MNLLVNLFAEANIFKRDKEAINLLSQNVGTADLP